MTPAIRILAAIVGLGGVVGVLRPLSVVASMASTGALQNLIDSGSVATVFGWMAVGLFFSGCSIVLAVLIFNQPVKDAT